MFDEEEKQRRLDLVDRFEPGKMSQTLLDAVFEDDEEGMEQLQQEMQRRGIRDEEDKEVFLSMKGDERERKRLKGEVPWFEWMRKWGYPPGWVAGKGELQPFHKWAGV